MPFSRSGTLGRRGGTFLSEFLLLLSDQQLGPLDLSFLVVPGDAFGDRRLGDSDCDD